MRKEIIAALSKHMPDVMRWSGSLARELRKHNIAITAKTSGSALTDALTLADLTIQDLLINAMRDRAPELLKCRIEAEESTGDLTRFASEGEYIIALDPIDGTKQFRDKSGDGYAVMLHLRTVDEVIYSLVYLPAFGEHGGWVEVHPDRIVTGADDPARPARDVLDSLTPIDAKTRPHSKKIYLIGFQQRDVERSEDVTRAGLEGVAPDDMPGSIYPLLATGEFGGSLIHTPNVYDYPVSWQIARQLGGDSVWVHDGQTVNFSEMWMDERADMLRLPGIVATSADQSTLEILCDLAREWSRERYENR
ncbi:inositol monophosphatase family protein [Rubinisphaera margarita]|uniref:inositol monophosphatase family protein n=1 Tax=Rubinisphaera margarita TaxID=2909586 RepID=UPI001EE86B1D|nr:inositol monophosphatase family protein [Rubinisphaera margarita]MCG6155149.1 inositol monophosphatase [Rubinisphaera margarita]